MLFEILKPTNEYSSFVFDGANRDIKDGRVENLAGDIDQMNMLDLYPGVITGERKIMDGQTRFMAARGLREPFWFIMGDDVSIEDMAEANANTNPYTQADALSVYAKMELPAYVYIRDFIERNPNFALSQARMLLNGKATGNSFIDGAFSVVSPKYAEIVAGYVNDLADVQDWIKRSKAYKQAMAILALNPFYDHERMMDRMLEVPVRLLKCGKAEEAIAVLNGIYNYNKVNRMNLSEGGVRINPYDCDEDEIKSDTPSPARVISKYRKVEIHCEGDLDKFTVHPSIRPLNQRGLNSLVQFMARRNLLRYYPIIVDRDLVVFDGQKRLAAARELGLPVYYIVSENISVLMVLLSGSRSKAWAYADYLKHFRALGLEDYIYTHCLFERFPFVPIALMCRYLGESNNGSASGMLFKSGKFRAVRRSLVEKFVSILSGLNVNHLKLNRTFQQVTLELMNNPDFYFSLLVKKINDNPDMFGPFGDFGSCKEQINAVYNYRTPHDKRVSF